MKFLKLNYSKYLVAFVKNSVSRIRNLSLTFFALSIFVFGSLYLDNSDAGNSCREIHNSSFQQLSSTFQVEDVVPFSFDSLERDRVYAVRLKDGSKKVIRFATSIGIQFETFASLFFQRFSTVQTSKVQKFNAKETLRLLGMLRINDPFAYQNIKENHGPRNLLASGVDFHNAKIGTEYLKSKGLDLEAIIESDGDMNQIVNEIVIYSRPARIPLKIQAQLADYWASALVLQILDSHPKNWMIKNNQVIAVDLAYPYQPQDLRQKADSYLHFRHVNSPFSFRNIRPELRDYLIGLISQRQLDLLKRLDAETIKAIALQAGLRLSDRQVQGILDRSAEILRLRNQL